MPTLAIFQLYRGMTKFIINLDSKPIRPLEIKRKTYLSIKQSDLSLYIQIKETLKR